MPVPLLAEGFGRGISNIPYVWTTIKLLPWIGLVYLLKVYFGGAKCQAERVMHGKVVMVTGGTSGIGAAVVQDLATRGAQIILLTRHAPNDPFLVDHIEDVRTTTNNELVYAEQVDLSSLHSIRLFATKWVDNAPPRRLDMLILCANTQTPYWGTSKTTVDGLEEEWAVNYLANFHLLSILSPAVRAQPPDREVRILFGTCSSYIGGNLELKQTETKTISGSTSFSRSKLAMMTFANAFQKHLDAYDRPDKALNNANSFIVDPGYSRTPGTRRWLTGGSLVGILVYLFTWPVWWLILKSPQQGAQSFLFAAMDAEFGRGGGGRLAKECRAYDILRPEVKNDEVAKKLWEFSENQIEQLEKEGAVKRALAKKEAETEARKETKRERDLANSNGAASGGEKSSTAGSRKNRKTK